MSDRAALIEHHRNRVPLELRRILRRPPRPTLLTVGHGHPPIRGVRPTGGCSITAAVDVVDGRILDVFEGRNAADLQAWLEDQPVEWVRRIEVVSVDPHEG
ncbi:MAG: hypothetical protein F2534_14425, partial [Actinobacteria bacterium]|nr:hypothetical protein [Actinomycetota bacterium]